MNKQTKSPSLEESELYVEKFITKKERVLTIILTVLFCIVCLVVLPFSIYFKSAYVSVEVVGSSMYGTLEDGDVVYMNVNRAPQRGDIVVVDVTKYKGDTNFSGEYIVKRVIAMAGDSLYASEGKVYIRQNGQTEFTLLDEPYLSPTIGTKDFEEVDVGEGEVFVMGDNRVNSYDSRNVGVFKTSDVIAVAPEWAYNIKEISTFWYWLFKPKK